MADPNERDALNGKDIGSWRIESMHREGGMGKVYLAHHRALETPAVFKALHGPLVSDLRYRERFFQEAKTQAQLQHPNVARILDFIEHEGQAFIVMEYVPGGTVAEMLDEAQGPLEVERALRYAEDALAGLDHAHRRAIIHRDVKSSNLLIDENDHVKVCDFGIAIEIGGNRMTVTGQAPGTPHYMSPEQIRRPAEVDHRTDVYSMGIVLYEMLTGQVPFDGATDFEIRQAQVSTPPRPPRELNSKIPEAVERVVLRALAKEPNDRYSGCGAFGAALKEVMRPVEILKPIPEPPPPSPRKSPWTPLFIGFLALLTMILTLVYLELRRERGRGEIMANDLEQAKRFIRASESPRLLYDDFSVNSGWWKPGTFDLPLSSGSTQINGFFQVSAKAKTPFTWKIPRHYKGDVGSGGYFMSARVYRIKGEWSGLEGGVLMASSDKAHCYALFSDSGYRLIKKSSDGEEEVVARDASLKARVDAWDRIAAVVTAKGIDVYLNGELADFAPVSCGVEGFSVGVAMALESGSATIAFDDFELRALP
ncbi:MAG: serine/threonine protein kinase [Thermoanaerobaculia bacterium]|nr:serine/threonine protein kinase [Thermoanaerobaculia bacterium]